MTPRASRLLSRVRRDAAHRAYQLLDWQRATRFARVTTRFALVTDALRFERVQGWRDAEAIAKRLEKVWRAEHVAGGLSGTLAIDGLTRLRAELRRHIREARQ